MASPVCPFEFTRFEVPARGGTGGNGGGEGTFPQNINASGTIVGIYADSSFKYHGFVIVPPYGPGDVTLIDPPTAVQTYAFGINDAGTICGWYVVTGSSVPHGFKAVPPYAPGDFTTIDVAGATFGTQIGQTFPWTNGLVGGGNPINTSGVISGNYKTGDGNQHGFIRAVDGTITTFNHPTVGVFYFSVGSINTAGDVAGAYPLSVAGGFVYHGFVRKADGTFTTYNDPSAGTTPLFGGSVGTIPFTLNDNGILCGYYLDADSNGHAFICDTAGPTYTTIAPDNQDITFQPFPTMFSLNGDSCTYAVGSYADIDNKVEHGLLRHTDGSLCYFDVPGAGTSNDYTGEGTMPQAISTKGIITGWYISGVEDSNPGLARGFICYSGCGGPPPNLPQRCVNVQPSGIMPSIELTRDLDADWDSASTFYIIQDEPLPFTLRGLVLRMSYNPD